MKQVQKFVHIHYLITDTYSSFFVSFLHVCATAAGGVGFWSTLVDGEVSHKALLALIFSLLDRKKQVDPWVFSQPLQKLLNVKAEVEC